MDVSTETHSVTTDSVSELVTQVLVTQSCLTLCDPTDCSLPASSVHGIFQARTLEWIAISFSRGSSPPRDWTQVFHIAGRLFTIWTTRKKQKWREVTNPSLFLKSPGIGRLTHSRFVWLLKFFPTASLLLFVALLQEQLQSFLALHIRVKI